jgi:hypothetical protein
MWAIDCGLKHLAAVGMGPFQIDMFLLSAILYCEP